MFVRAEEISNPEYGKYPGARSVEELLHCGIVVLDKPSGPSSHQVVAWVKEILGVKKVGHSGTLDPKVTGVLIVTLEKATKIIPAVMGLDKEYVAVMHLHGDVEIEKIKEVAKKFTGEIIQLPPRRSAVRRKKRVRKVYEIEVLEKVGRDVLMRIKCESGTYVRKLIHDMGLELGKGAHMKELRRTKVGEFTESMATTLQDLKDYYILWKERGDEKIKEIIKPVEFGVEHLKKIWVRDSAVNALCNGAPLAIGGVCRFDEEIKEGELVAIFTLKGELVALARAEVTGEKMKKLKRGIVARVDRVVMEKDLYPRMWKR